LITSWLTLRCQLNLQPLRRFAVVTLSRKPPRRKPNRVRRKLQRPERKQAVIEPKRETKPQAVVKAPEVKAVPAQPKRTETAAVSEPAKRQSRRLRRKQRRPQRHRLPPGTSSDGNRIQQRSR
jgi:hypothetical protein